MGVALAQSPEWNRELSTGPSSSLPEVLKKPPQGFGFGLHGGVPFGLALSFYKKRSTQQAVVGWNLNKSQLRLTADQLITAWRFESDDLMHFPLNLGAGFWVRKNDEVANDFGQYNIEDSWGFRFPIGLSMNHKKVAIDIYGEVVPSVQVKPYVTMKMMGGVGSRMYFF